VVNKIALQEYYLTVISEKIFQLEEILKYSELFFSKRLSINFIKQILIYYQIVLKWNSQLHLTTLHQPLEFAQHHILESIIADCYIYPLVRNLWDLGSGLGIPGIPIAISRPDLSVFLIESNRKKAIFLKEAITSLRLNNVSVINSRFELIGYNEPSLCITSRAIEKMGTQVPNIFKFGFSGLQILLFVNELTRSQVFNLLPQGWSIKSLLLPSSNNRFLISLLRST